MCVCVCVCVCVYLLNYTQPRNPALSSSSFYATRIDPVRVCVCIFIKLHITTQSGPVILVIVCVCVFIELHITAQSGPVILVILCHPH